MNPTTYTITRQIVTGKTYPVKDAIKAAGARWDGATREWVVTPDTRIDQLPESVTVATVPDHHATLAAIRKARPGRGELDRIIATAEELLRMGSHPGVVEQILSINWTYDEIDTRDDIWYARWTGHGNRDWITIEDAEHNPITRVYRPE